LLIVNLIFFEEFGDDLAAVLSQIRFITTGNQAFKPSQLYDRASPLFVAGIQTRILPDEYYNDYNWLLFLGFLNLNIIPSDEDILEMAKIFSQHFESKL